jgi:two-component system, OmpR family, phosphate regulon sensor histidine kinase PhoR
VTVALFWRKVTLDEALEAVRMEMERLRPGMDRPVPLVQISRLLAGDASRPALESLAPELLEGIPDPAGILEEDGRFSAVNAKFDSFVGEGRARGRTLLELSRSAELYEAASRALSGEAGGGQFRLPALQKSISASLSPLPGGRALAVLRDVTDQQRLEAVRRDFIANASHELRTPVSAITGAVETILALPPEELGGTARSFVEMIARHSARLSRLTRDLLDLSRLETGEFALEIGPLEVAPLSAACLDLFRKIAQDKKITLGYDGPDALRVLADRRAIEQILVNLLDNAVKYTPEAGRIAVLADDAGNEVVLSVFDTGPGIEPRQQARVFERFYRADPGRSREMGGTGLGLAIVKHLAQAQGGQVGVESGQGGSRFWVRLPKAP